MRRLALIAALAATGIAGCGGAAHHALTFPQPHGAPCHPRNPPALGECVGQHFGRPPAAAPLTSGALCQDWSQWQGAEPPTGGLACVIIQSNYGLHVEPTVWSQVRDASVHHVACGLYTFMEGASGASEARLAVSLYHRTPCTLGVSADAEIGSAYSHACAYTAEAIHLGVLALLYTAPGLWPGGRCQGYLWPAEWGIGAPYPFGGYPSSAIKLWQWCGTCARDLDRDQGLIALGQPPVPLTRVQKTRLLHRLQGDQAGLRRQIAGHRAFQARFGCTRRRHAHEHLGQRCRRSFRAGDRAHARGAANDRVIRRLHREGIR